MALIPIDGNTPKFLARRQGGGSLDAAQVGTQGGALTTLSVRGGIWRIRRGGQEVELEGRHLDVVVVGVSRYLSKAFYDEGYIDGAAGAPVCASVDGIKPDPGVADKQAELCSTCPNNVWGSGATAARPESRAKACQDNKRIVVVPYDDIANEPYGGPMLLRIPPTSLRNFGQYAGFLASKQVADIWWVGTRLEFDTKFTHPVIAFKPIGFVTEEQDQQIAALQENAPIDDMLYRTTVADAGADTTQDIAGTPPPRARLQVAAPLKAAAPGPLQQPPAPRRGPFQQVTTRAPARAPAAAPANPPPDLSNAIDDLLNDPA